MRLLAGFALLLALLPVASAQKASDLLALQGDWAGSYNCGGEFVPVNISIAQNISYPDGLSATFTFGKQTDSGIYAVGEFYMKVARLSYNDFRFEPTQWVTRPPGYDWFSLRAELENGHISGTVEHPACSTFRVGPAENH